MTAPDPKKNVPWLLWGAFLISHVLIAVIGLLIPDPEAALPQDQLQPILLAVSVAGVGMLVFAIGIAPRRLAALDYNVSLIVRFACAESVTIFGFVLAQLGVEPAISLAFAGFGLLAHLLFAPTEADRRRHEHA